MAGNIKGVTLEYGADTRKVEKSLREINKESRNLDSQLRQVNNSLKFNPGNTDLLAQKQRILAESVSKTKDKLQLLKEAQIEMSQQLKNGDIGIEEYEKLQREILKTENALKRLEDQQTSTTSKFKEAGKNIEEVGKKIKGVGEDLTKKVTLPIVGVGAASLKAFKEVDKGMDIVITKTGATGEKVKDLKSSFDNVYGNFPTDSETAGNALGEVNTQFGFMGKELEENSILLLKFSRINGQDVTNSTINAKQAMEAFNLSNKDLGLILDSVTKTAQDTGVSTEKLFDTVIKGAPTLQSMGLNFSQSVAIMGSFEQAGIESSKAIGAMTKAQVNFAKEGLSMSDGLKGLTENIKNATSEQEAINFASEVFGTKAGPAMAKAIKEGRLNLDDFANSALQAKDSVNKTFNETKDPMEDFTTAFNNLKIVGADIGKTLLEALAPVLTDLIAKLKEFATWFKSLSPHQKELIIKIAAIVAVIGPLLVIIGQMAVGLGGLVTLFTTIGPAIIGVIPAIISLMPVLAALLGAFLIGQYIYKHWDEIKAYLSKVWNSIKKACELFFNGIKTYFKKVLEDYKKNFTDSWNEIKNITSNIWKGIETITKNIWNGIKTFLKSYLENILSFYKNIFEKIKNVISGIWNAVKTVTSSIWNGIQSSLNGIFNNILNFFSRAFNRMKAIASEVMNSIGSTISRGFDTAVSTVFNFGRRFYEAGKNIIGSIADGIRHAIGWVTGAIEDVVSTIREYLPFSPAKRGPLRDLNKLNFGGTISEGIYNAKSTVNRAMESILQIPSINIGDMNYNSNFNGNQTEGRNIVINIEKMSVNDENTPSDIAYELNKIINRNPSRRGIAYGY